ncbi:hypothetical protein [Yersinia aldovae]|uniref:Lipoprotein n=1 Tax=Yersinia aldovae TaxID=29483 RepID=A0ABM9SQY7_YERAL|nr:hypothetical protein [Yersinia aldovae]CNK76994.1 putative lipoprotein [Yersinia aldovae]
MKLKIVLFTLLSWAVYAQSDLQEQCKTDGSTIVYNKTIQGYNASIMWRPGEPTGNTFNAISVKIDDKWYGAIAEDRTHGNSAVGLSSFAQAAYLIGLPVNACVRDKYLRGLEGVN